MSELTAHRTLALRDAVANRPQVALTALLHKLCHDTFQHSAPGACLEASVRHVFFPVQATGLKDSPSAKAVAKRHEALKADLPKDEDALWDWLAALGDSRRIALLAHCVSFGVNALYEKGDRYGGPGVSAHGVQNRIAQADRLARAVSLDMVEAGWRTTVDNYLGRVTKPRILEAVREVKGDQAAQLIDHLKKSEMAKEAERLLDGTAGCPSRCGWPMTRLHRSVRAMRSTSCRHSWPARTALPLWPRRNPSPPSEGNGGAASAVPHYAAHPPQERSGAVSV